MSIVFEYVALGVNCVRVDVIDTVGIIEGDPVFVDTTLTELVYVDVIVPDIDCDGEIEVVSI
jgi:hypothetical protein